MLVRQKIWRNLPGAGNDDGHPLDNQLPSEKIIVRLRSTVTPGGLRGGEKLRVWKENRGQMVRMEVDAGGGGKHQELVEYRVDRALGPSAEDTVVYQAAAAHLVDRAVRGRNGLLLLTGTPRSENAHAVCKRLAPPRALDSLLPSALADLTRRWGCDTERWYRLWQPPAGLAQLAPPPAPPATGVPNFAVRICFAEIRGGVDCQTRDLLRDINDVATVGNGGAGEGKESSSSAPVRSLTFPPNGPLAMIVSPGDRPPEVSGGGGAKDGLRLSSVGQGRGRGKAGREAVSDLALLTSAVLLGMTEATAGGLDEALALIRKSRATGELVFVEMGDCPGGDLPKTLLTLLELLKRSNQLATSAHQPPESSAGGAVEQTAPWATPHNSDSGRSSADPLRAFLESLAGSVAALRGFPAQAAAAATAASSPKVGGCQRSSTSLNSWRGAALSSESQAEATEEVPLAVSVMATLDVGSAFCEENAALLEALARSSRKRQKSWRSFKRMLKSIPSLARRFSQVKREAAATTTAVPKDPPSFSSSEDSRGLSPPPHSTLTAEAAPDDVNKTSHSPGDADRPFNDAAAIVAAAVETAPSPASLLFARAAASVGYLIEDAPIERSHGFLGEDETGRGPSPATGVSPSRKSPVVPGEPMGQVGQGRRKTPHIASDPARGTEKERYSCRGLGEEASATTPSIARSEEADRSNAARFSPASRENFHADRDDTEPRLSADRERSSGGGFERGEGEASAGSGGEASTNPRQDPEEGDTEEQVNEGRHCQDPIRQLLLLPADELAKRVLQAEKTSSYWKSQHVLSEKKLAELRAQLWPTKIGTILGEAIPSPRPGRGRRDALVDKRRGISDANEPAGERHTLCDGPSIDRYESFPPKAFLRESGGMILGEGGNGTVPAYPRAHASSGGAGGRAREATMSPSRLSFEERRALFCPREKHASTAMNLAPFPEGNENGVAKKAAPAFVEHPLGSAAVSTPRASEAPLVVEGAAYDDCKRKSLPYRATGGIRPNMIERANGLRFTFHGEDPAGAVTAQENKTNSSSGSQTLRDSSMDRSSEEAARSGLALVSGLTSHLTSSADQASPRTSRTNASSTTVMHPRAAISKSPRRVAHTGRLHQAPQLPRVVPPHTIPGGSGENTLDVDSACSSVYSPSLVSPPSFSRPRAEGRAVEAKVDGLGWVEETESSPASCRPTWNTWDGIWEGRDRSPAGWWRQSAPSARRSRSPDEGAGGGRSPRAWPVGSGRVAREGLVNSPQMASPPPQQPRFSTVGSRFPPPASSKVASSSSSASPATVLDDIKSRLLATASQLPDDIMSPDEAAAAEAAAGALEVTTALMSVIKTRDSTTSFLSTNAPRRESWGRPSAAYRSRHQGWDGRTKSFALPLKSYPLPANLPPHPAPLPQVPEKSREAMMEVY